MKHFFLSLFLLSAACSHAISPGDFSVQVYNGTGFTPYYITLANGQVIGKTGGVPAAITPGGGGGGSTAWVDITGKPTTLSGYGITDALSATLAASTYQPLIGTGTLALSKLATDPLARANHTGTQTLSTISDAGALAALNAVASAQITDGTIVNADISASAAIALSKLATDPLARANHTGTQTLSTISDAGALAALNAVASAQITDGTIVNADISASAAIALSKLATDPLARGNHTGTQAWSTITGTPTTRSGYGITDAQAQSSRLDTLAAGFAPFQGFISWDGSTFTMSTNLAGSFGGTGHGSYATGDLLYGSSPTSLNVLAGNTTTKKQWLSQTGNGTASAAPAWSDLPAEIVIVCSDETTDLTTGTAKRTFRMPHAMVLTSVLIEVNTAPTGSVIIVDVKEAGTTIFSTKPQIAIGAYDSSGGAVPGVLSDTSLALRAVITVNIDQIGSTIAGKGLKVTLIGTR